MNRKLEASMPGVRGAVVGLLAIVAVVLAGSIGLAGLRAALIRSDAKTFEKNRTGEKKEEPKKEQADEWAELKKGGLIGKPPPQIPPPMLSAVIGEEAIINGQPVKVGAVVGDGLKVIEIHPDKVVLEKDGQKQEMKVFNGI